MSLMAQDMIDILDHEKLLENVIGIGHDCIFVYAANSELRLQGIPFLNRKGFRLSPHRDFLTSDDAPKIIEEHIDSFYSLFFPSDLLYWKEYFAPPGKMREWVSSNRIESKVPYLSLDEIKQHQNNILQGGLAAPLCWYKAIIGPTQDEDRYSKIDPDRLVIQRPVFFGATLRDFVCLPAVGKPAIQKLCPNSRIVDFDADHWVMCAVTDKLNAELLDWIISDVEGLASKG